MPTPGLPIHVPILMGGNIYGCIFRTNCVICSEIVPLISSKPSPIWPHVQVDAPGHPLGVTPGTVYHSRDALAAANVHVAADRTVSVVGRKRPQVTSVLDTGGRRISADDGSCMLEIRLPKTLDTLTVRNRPIHMHQTDFC